MNHFLSTRNSNNIKTGLMSVIEGLSEDGGLYTPDLRQIQKIDFSKYLNYSYRQLAKEILLIFFDELNKEEVNEIVDKAYDNKFSKKEAVNLRKIKDDYFLELYHGPTCAFKDMALTILPRLLKTAYKKNNIDKKIYILTATSGDTGKAALEGFRDVEDTYISIFFPKDKVSKIQEKQMLTSLGNNTDVIQVEGNFDDCQKIVKDLLVNEELKNDKTIFSSANSINVGRLIPQIIYYVYSYLQLVSKKEIEYGEEISFVVPCGNFGNILAGYIAKKCSLPIKHLVCASNSNDVLTEFIQTGHYNKNRNFFKTISPSMDILVSSNVERLLYLLSNYDSKLVSSYMDKLQTEGEYQLSNDLFNKLSETFVSYCFDDKKTKEGIKEIYEENHHLIDTHTSVAYLASKQYKKTNHEKLVIVSTASCYKFAKDVYSSIFNNDSIDEFKALEELEKINDEKIPEALKNLDQKEIKHNTVINKENAVNTISERIKQW